MLVRIATSLPLGSADALFARGIAWLSPIVGGEACQPECLSTFDCGSCSCPPGSACGPTVSRRCDNCGGAFCFCNPCDGPC